MAWNEMEAKRCGQEGGVCRPDRGAAWGQGAWTGIRGAWMITSAGAGLKSAPKQKSWNGLTGGPSTFQERDWVFPAVLRGWVGLWTIRTRRDMCQFLKLVEWNEKGNRLAESWPSGWDWSRSSLGLKVRMDSEWDVPQKQTWGLSSSWTEDHEKSKVLIKKYKFCRSYLTFVFKLFFFFQLKNPDKELQGTLADFFDNNVEKKASALVSIFSWLWWTNSDSSAIESTAKASQPLHLYFKWKFNDISNQRINLFGTSTQDQLLS